MCTRGNLLELELDAHVPPSAMQPRANRADRHPGSDRDALVIKIGQRQKQQRVSIHGLQASKSRRDSRPAHRRVSAPVRAVKATARTVGLGRASVCPPPAHLRPRVPSQQVRRDPIHSHGRASS